MRTQRLNWMTSTALSLALAGCLQAEVIPLADAGRDTMEDTGTEDAGTDDMGEDDPSVHWPVVAHDFERKISSFYSCESALLWSFSATEDSLGNLRNDEEVWAWEVGGTPQVLAAHLRPVYHRLAGCHEGFAYWTETDGDVSSLHRRSTSASAAAELVHAGERWSTWTMGDHGRLTTWLDDESGIEVFDVDDSTVIVVPFGDADVWRTGTEVRASGDYLYLTGLGHRIAFTPGAEWTRVNGNWEEDVFAPVPDRLVGANWGPNNVLVWQQEVGGTRLTLAESCGSTPNVSPRGGWVLWNFASTSGDACAGVGRSTVDEHGNVHSQPFPELSRWVEEMADATVDGGWPQIFVVQFGAEIAFFNLALGTIRLADEPPFPCVDPTLPCPPGGVCATTLCADLPN